MGECLQVEEGDKMKEYPLVYILTFDDDILGVFDNITKAVNFREDYIDSEGMESWREDFQIEE